MVKVQCDIRSMSLTDVIYMEMALGTLLYVKDQVFRSSALTKPTYLTAYQQISYFYGNKRFIAVIKIPPLCVA